MCLVYSFQYCCRHAFSNDTRTSFTAAVYHLASLLAVNAFRMAIRSSNAATHFSTSAFRASLLTCEPASFE